MKYIARIKTIDPEIASSVFITAWEAGDHELEVIQNSIINCPGHNKSFEVPGDQFPKQYLDLPTWTMFTHNCPHLGGGDCVLELVPDDYILNQ